MFVYHLSDFSSSNPYLLATINILTLFSDMKKIISNTFITLYHLKSDFLFYNLIHQKKPTTSIPDIIESTNF